MTRKDYVLIAEAIRAVSKDWERAASESHRAIGAAAIAGVAREIALALSRDNPRFDRARFLAASETYE